MAGIKTSLEKLKESPDLKVIIIKSGGGALAAVEGLLENAPALGMSVAYNTPASGADSSVTQANTYTQIGAKHTGLDSFGGVNNLMTSMKYWATSESAPFAINILLFGPDAFKKAWHFYSLCFPETVGDYDKTGENAGILSKAFGGIGSVVGTIKDGAMNLFKGTGETLDTSGETGDAFRAAANAAGLKPPFWGGSRSGDFGTVSLRIGTWLHVPELVVDSFYIDPSPELVYESNTKSHPAWVRVTATLSTSRRVSAQEVRDWYVGS